MSKDLKLLAQRANLSDPEQVKTAIARYIKKNGQAGTNNFKVKLTADYNRYCQFHKIEWTKPHYTKEDVSIQPPTKTRIEMLIASAKGEMSLKLDVSYRTGLRPIEVAGDKGIQVKNVHFDDKTITARITKGCNARPPLPIGEALTTRLKTYVEKKHLKPEDRLFTTNHFSEHYIRFRDRLADKLHDQTIRTVRLYDIRHAYATRQLLRTQNAETVRIIMGHKRLDTTQRYLHLLNLDNGEWAVEGTTDKKRAQELLEADFTYQLTTPDGTMLFRKRK